MLKVMNNPNPVNEISKQKLSIPEKNPFLPYDLSIKDYPNIFEINISE